MVANTETLTIKSRPSTGMYEIIRSTGGKIHNSMEGLFTTTSLAQRAIDFYTDNIEQEMVKQDLAKEKREYVLRAKIKEEKRIAKELKEEQSKQKKTKPGKK